jgi:hypothetical protein
LNRDPRLADVAQPALYVPVEATLEQRAHGEGRVWRQFAEIDRRAQHVRQRVRDRLAVTVKR